MTEVIADDLCKLKIVSSSLFVAVNELTRQDRDEHMWTSRHTLKLTHKNIELKVKKNHTIYNLIDEKSAKVGKNEKRSQVMIDLWREKKQSVA